MSDYAKLTLIDDSGLGKPREELLKELSAIRAWQSGKDWKIKIYVKQQLQFDDLQNVEDAVNGDLEAYIRSKFIIRPREIFKTGGRSELILMINPNLVGEDGKSYRKKRSGMTHLTPKKKKRKR